jgi:AraC-like DNA-binding protein
MDQSGPTIAVAQQVAQRVRVMRPDMALKPLFARHDLPDLFTAPPDTRIRLLQEAGFVQDACVEVGDIDLGFEVGLAHTTPGNLPAYIARHSPTVREGIVSAVQYVRAVRPGFEYRLDESGNVARLQLTISDPALSGYPRLIELLFAGITAQIREFTKRAFYPHGLTFCHARVGLSAGVRARLGCNVEFSADRTEMLIGFETLDTPVTSRDDVLRGFLIAEGERALARQGTRPLSAAETVELLVENGFPDTQPSLSAIAREMGLSDRSLSRRLQEAQTSFKQIVGHVRQRIAARELGETDLSVGEIAYRLGYASQSAFATAFRRETGLSPSAYRKNHKAAQPPGPPQG